MSTSGPAGQVTAAIGEVSATREGQEARPLKLDDIIYADDTVRTGADSSIAILLRHNGARWELAAESTRRVDQSAAWRARRHAVGALEKSSEDPKTASAGRNTTREAAESVETLLDPPKPDEDPSVHNEPHNEPKPERRPEKKIKANKDPRQQQQQQQQRISKRPKPDSKTTKSPPPPPPPAMNMPISQARPETARVTDPKSAQNAFLRKQIRSCHKEHGGAGTLHYTLSAKDRKPTEVKVSGDPALDAVVACVRAKLQASTLPNDETISGQTQLASP